MSTLTLINQPLIAVLLKQVLTIWNNPREKTDYKKFDINALRLNYVQYLLRNSEWLQEAYDIIKPTILDWGNEKLENLDNLVKYKIQTYDNLAEVINAMTTESMKKEALINELILNELSSEDIEIKKQGYYIGTNYEATKEVLQAAFYDYVGSIVTQDNIIKLQITQTLAPNGVKTLPDTTKINIVNQPLAFSINDTVTNKVQDNYAFTHNFENKIGTVEDLKKNIKLGYPFSCKLKEETSETGKCHKKGENFIQSQIIALDFDEYRISSFIRNTNSFLCNFIYTTASHQQEGKGDRFRAVWILAKPIENQEDMRYLIKHLLYLFPEADQATKDPCRGVFTFDGTTITDLDREAHIDNITALKWIEDQKQLEQLAHLNKITQIAQEAKYKRDVFGNQADYFDRMTDYEKGMRNKATLDKICKNMPFDYHMDYSDYLDFIAGITECVGVNEAISYFRQMWSGDWLLRTIKKLPTFDGSRGIGTTIWIAKKYNWL